MSSCFGNKIKVSIFGQSHGESIGAVVDGLPAGEGIDLERLQAFMRRRAPGQALSSPRSEADKVEIVSGLYQGRTCGAPLCAIIQNTNLHSGDYDEIAAVPRPGHADYPAHVKHHGFQDPRGGGHFSGRLTAAMCAAGGILIQLFDKRGIHFGAHLLQVGSAYAKPFDPLKLTEKDLLLYQSGFPTLPEESQAFRNEIISAAQEGDSIGGLVECAILGLPIGLGEPLFDGIENRIAQAIFAIPAVKGLEFGEGFRVVSMRGSQNNDPYQMHEGQVQIMSNHAGGILGGLSTGLPLLFNVAFKPTPSIFLPQASVRLPEMSNTILSVKGRHDPCVALRAVPVVEAAAALALADLIL